MIIKCTKAEKETLLDIIGSPDIPCVLHKADKCEDRCRPCLERNITWEIVGSGLTIREVIDILIDAPDKDKPFLIEIQKGTIPDDELEWHTINISQLVNCGYASMATADKVKGN